MVEFIPVEEENFEQVIRLEVKESQSKFVAPNVRSLAECYLYRKNEDVFPYAIQDGELIVGFLLLDLDADEKEMMIWRMMIDKDHQGKGYGRQTVQKVIELAEKDPKYTVLIADYVKGNDAMGHLLKNLGFIEQSFNEKYNEHVLHYNLEAART
ncbi:MAG: GNAT family N-acetyltransferase [Alkalibacterium sp.]|nr:GNAT family N-acetyltransferase [Alkalibacterium sp.]